MFREAFTPNDAFYVRWHSAVPEVSLADWRLRVAGPGVQSPREFTHAELTRKFKVHGVAAVNQCSGNRRGLFVPHVRGVQWGYGAMGNARWRGVRLKDVLEDAGLAGSALEVVGNGADAPMLTGPDFVKSLPMWKALVDLRVTDTAYDGFWMKTAYRVPKDMFGASGFASQDTVSNSAITSITVNSLLVDPAPDAVLPVGRRTEVHGIAWDGGSGIRKVQYSLDGGANWREARLGRELGRYSWRQRRGDRRVSRTPLRQGSRPVVERHGPVVVRARSRAAVVDDDPRLRTGVAAGRNPVETAAVGAARAPQRVGLTRRLADDRPTHVADARIRGRVRDEHRARLPVPRGPVRGVLPGRTCPIPSSPSPAPSRSRPCSRGTSSRPSC